jgi:hypothetical protein
MKCYTKEDEMACSTYEGYEECMKNFGQKS